MLYEAASLVPQNSRSDKISATPASQVSNRDAKSLTEIFMLPLVRYPRFHVQHKISPGGP